MTDGASTQTINTMQIRGENSQLEDVIALHKENSDQDEKSLSDSRVKEIDTLNDENVEMDETEEDITEDQINTNNSSTDAEPSWLEHARTDLDVYQNLDAPKLEQILFHTKSIEQIINSVKSDTKQTNKVSGVRKLEQRARTRYNRR